jgi:hypothetical protein
MVSLDEVFQHIYGERQQELSLPGKHAYWLAEIALHFTARGTLTRRAGRSQRQCSWANLLSK